MPIGRAVRMMVATGVMAALVLGSANPVASEVLPTRAFGLWPPHFCAKSAGNGQYVGRLRYYIAAATSSMKAAGSDGDCDDPSPAPAGTFSAMPRLQVYFAPTGGWSECNYEHYLRRVNVANASVVTSAHTVYGCGAAPHRLWSGSRITYDGNNQYDNRYTGEL
ncbi:MAG TPA: hypothetical protein VK507_16550 [Iamia sp.]|nr:hypothetical protein [Iamia sp.]